MQEQSAGSTSAPTVLNIPAVSSQRPRRLRVWLGVTAGLCIGLLAGIAGMRWAFAAPETEGEKARAITEEVFLEYTLDNENSSVRWADWTSKADTYLAIRLQSEPEKVYVTPMMTDNPGFARPCQVTVPRAFLSGEKAYVYVMDDDSWSDRHWKLIARTALEEGGCVAGKMVSTWTLGQVPDRVVVALFNRAGDAVAELTLDADDCLATTQVQVRSQPLSFQTQEEAAAELTLSDRSGASAGSLRVVYGHRGASTVIAE